MTTEIRSAIQKSIFGATIRTLRQACGKDIESFSAEAGLDSDRVKEIEMGLASVDVLSEIPRLAEAFARQMHIGTQALISALRQSYDLVENYEIFDEILSPETTASGRRGSEQSARGDVLSLCDLMNYDLEDQGEDA